MVLFIFWVIWEVWSSNHKNSNNLRKKKEIHDKFWKREINKNLSIIDRNTDIINHHLNKIHDDYFTYYIENAVKDCIIDIGNAEWNYDIIKWWEYLSNWTPPTSEYKVLKNHLINLFNRRKEEIRSENKKRREKEEAKKQIIIKEKSSFIEGKYDSLIEKFYTITDRKVSILDDYGDKNWDELENQLYTVICKIGKLEWFPEASVREWKKSKYIGSEELRELMNSLRVKFKLFHKNQNSSYKQLDLEDISTMSWIDFEVYVWKLFNDIWYSITWTSASWDQWADLIASKNWKTTIIQVKRYNSNVWNKAVQEVIWAIKYYNWDNWCVVTNSKYTKSAKELAQKNNIILIEWYDLNKLNNYF